MKRPGDTAKLNEIYLNVKNMMPRVIDIYFN